MNLRNAFILCAATLLMGCDSTSGGVAPVQTANPPMTAERAAEMAKPDPSLSSEQNAAKGQMAQDELKRNEYYSQKYGASAGGK